jgi:hypothetical protein
MRAKRKTKWNIFEGVYTKDLTLPLSAVTKFLKYLPFQINHLPPIPNFAAPPGHYPGLERDFSINAT